MAVRLDNLRRSLAQMSRCAGDNEYRVYSTDLDPEGLEIGRVWAYDDDHAMERAIEAWVDCGGEYTEALSVRRVTAVSL